MRLSPGSAWRPFRAEQRMKGAVVDFRWRAWFFMAPLAPFLVVDAFDNGSGRLSVSAFGLLPVARGRGLDLDRGAASSTISS